MTFTRRRMTMMIEGGDDKNDDAKQKNEKPVNWTETLKEVMTIAKTVTMMIDEGYNENDDKK